MGRKQFRGEVAVAALDVDAVEAELLRADGGLDHAILHRLDVGVGKGLHMFGNLRAPVEQRIAHRQAGRRPRRVPVAPGVLKLKQAERRMRRAEGFAGRGARRFEQRGDRLFGGGLDAHLTIAAAPPLPDGARLELDQPPAPRAVAAVAPEREFARRTVGERVAPLHGKRREAVGSGPPSDRRGRGENGEILAEGNVEAERFDLPPKLVQCFVGEWFVLCHGPPSL